MEVTNGLLVLSFIFAILILLVAFGWKDIKEIIEIIKEQNGKFKGE